MENIVKNKWFKISKYLLAGLLILASIFSLLASWYGDKNIAFGDGVIASPNNATAIRIACLILGILGFFISIFTLANTQKTLSIIIGFILSFIFVILLFSLAGTLMTNMTYYVKVGFL